MCAWNDLNINTQIVTKISYWRLYYWSAVVFISIRKLSRPFYIKTYMRFSEYIEWNSLNVYRKKKRHEQELWRRKNTHFTPNRPIFIRLIFYAPIINGTDATFMCPNLHIAQLSKVFRLSKSQEPLTARSHYTLQFCLSRNTHTIKTQPNVLLTKLSYQNLKMTFRGPCIVIYSYNKSQEMQYFSNLFWKKTLHV